MPQVFATSSVNDVINALVNCFESVLSGTNVEVFDGAPVNLPDQFIAIGGTTAPTFDGTQDFQYVGNSAMEEDYTLEGTISTFAGGSSQANPDASPNQMAGNAQKRARDAAFGILNTIGNAILNDKQLTSWGAPFANGNGWVAAVKLSGMQTVYNDEESAKGRRIEITFTVSVRNHLGAIA